MDKQPQPDNLKPDIISEFLEQFPQKIDFQDPKVVQGIHGPNDF